MARRKILLVTLPYCLLPAALSFVIDRLRIRPQRQVPNIMELSGGTASDKNRKQSVPSLTQNSNDVKKIDLKRATLRVFGPDAKGIVAAFSQLLYGHGCGIIDSEQSTDTHTNIFFQRLHYDYEMLHTDKMTLEKGIREVCERFGMQYMLNWNTERKRVAIFVSKYEHCLWELLLRHKAGELDCEIACIISNHPDLESVAETFGIPFHVFAITKATKEGQERLELELLKRDCRVDLVILARYMQIFSDDFCNAFPDQIINIHHSFLPAFVGGKPYHRAHERGVKLIGATVSFKGTVELHERAIHL
jgi:formyltetrahydrofolate deformylase